MAIPDIVISPVNGKADTRDFIDLAYRLNETNPNWVPPLKDEVRALITPGRNPWFEHGEARYFLARRGDGLVGRISAQIDRIALDMPPDQGFGPGTGFWGMIEAEDGTVMAALIAAAADWLRSKAMTRMIGPVSLGMWDEPGLLIDGFDTPPTVMMGYNRPEYQAWIEATGQAGVQDLFTFAVPIRDPFPPIVQRIVALGEKSERIVIRRARKANFDAEARTIIGILNDAWSDNWGFTPFTEAEIAYAGKKLKPIIYEDLVRIAEVDGEAVAFMMTIPDINEKLRGFGGSLFPFNWAKLLWWLRAPKVRTMRVPLMGVAKKLQSSRMASQLAFMMIDYIRRDSVANFGATYGEFGWVLASNGPMRSVGEAVGGTVNKIYRVYQSDL